MQAAAPVMQAPVPGQRSAPTATEMYEAAQLARRELRNQQDQLQGERRRVQSQLSQARNETDIKGLQGRLTVLDGRIADVDKQLASADALVANRAAIPGVVVQEPRNNNEIPPEAMVMSGMGMAMILLLPFSIAMARRVWRRTTLERPVLPPDISDRLSNMERGIEAVAIEVERLGEGQRFVTQLLAEADKRRQLQALPAESRRDA